MTNNKTSNKTENQLFLPTKDQFPSRKEWEKACWRKIVKSEKLLNSLITSNERHNIVMRATIMNLLNLRNGPQQISRELQVSRQTINSIKKTAKEGDYKSYRERGKTERKKKVWSISSFQKKKEPYRRYRRTKYGKVYLP